MDNLTNFDLFIGECEKPIIDIDSFINRIQESEFGKYINIRKIIVDKSTVQMRNLSTGSIQFVAYISANTDEEPACNWYSGFQRVAVCSNGVCVLDRNINSKVETHMEMTEEILFNSVKAAFYFILDICKKLHFNITGDELGISNYK